MKLTVSKEAAQWYIKEMDLNPGDNIKFFGKVYGKDGFSFAIAKMEPSRPEVQIEVEGINFYVEKSDAWFFSEQDFEVVIDQELNEPTFKKK